MDVLDFGLAPLRDYMPGDVFEAALSRARRLVFEDGETLHARGDAASRLCIIASGAVRLGRYQPGGSFNLVAMVGVGGHFGEIGLQRTIYTHDAFSVGRSEIHVIAPAALERLLVERPDFTLGLWRANTARFNALLELYDDARTLDVTARLAKVIYVHRGRGEIPDGVACVQRDLAELLGVSKVSIGSALRALENAGLAEAGYRCVRAPSKARLKAWLRQSGAA